jgi:hypothetical protein
MTDTAVRAAKSAAPRGWARVRDLGAVALPTVSRRSGPRHPLVATAIAVPIAALLAVAFGGWHAVVVQASSVAGMLGR